MSSREVRLQSIVGKQYIYRLKGHSGLIYALILAQLLGLLFSMSPRGAMSSGDEFLHVYVGTYSTDTLLFFSMVWVVVIAAQLISKAYRNLEFPLVTNNITSHLSNILLIVTYSVFAGITSTLMSVLHRVIMVLASDQSKFVFDDLALTTYDLVLGSFVLIFYMVLLAATSYLIRLIIEVNKLFAIIIPAVIIGLLRVYPRFSEAIFDFFAAENSLGFFTLKVFFTAIILFGMSVLLSNRMEVK